MLQWTWGCIYFFKTLLLISSLIPPWSENTLCRILILWKLLIGYIAHSVVSWCQCSLFTWKEFVFLALGCSMSIRLCLLIMFKCSVVFTFLFWCTFSVSETGTWKSPTILGILSIYPFNSVNFFYLLGACVIRWP